MSNQGLISNMQACCGLLTHYTHCLCSLNLYSLWSLKTSNILTRFVVVCISFVSNTVLFRRCKGLVSFYNCSSFLLHCLLLFWYVSTVRFTLMTLLCLFDLVLTLLLFGLASSSCYSSPISSVYLSFLTCLFGLFIISFITFRIFYIKSEIFVQ